MSTPRPTPEEYARTAAIALWNCGLLTSASQIGGAAAVIAMYTRDVQTVERERCSLLVFDCPDPAADVPPRDAQTVAIEAYRKAIRGSE